MARRGRLILIVDPDLDFVEDTRLLLQNERILTARSLEEAEDIAVGGRVDVAIVGPSFGHEAGVRAAGAILGVDPTVQLVLAANVVTNRVLLAALQTGFADVVDTPLTVRKLTAALASRSRVPAPASIVSAHASPADALRADVVVEFSGPAGMATGTVASPAVGVPAVEMPAVPAASAVITAPVVPEPPAAPAVVAPAPAAAVVEPTPAPAVEPVVVASSEADSLESALEPVAAALPTPAEEPLPPPPATPPPQPAAPDPLPPPFPPPPAGPPPTEGPVEEIAAPPSVPEILPEPADPGTATAFPVRPGGESRVIVVMAGKGGSGKSVTATNLAMALTFAVGEDAVGLVDADLQFGDVALLLQMDPVRSVVEVARQVDDLSEARLDAMVLRHESGLRVLPAPLQPAGADSLPPKAVVQVVEKMRRLYRFVVVDTGAVLDDVLLTLLDHADDVVVVVDMDLPSVKNAKVALDILRAGGYPMDRMLLVVNRINAKARLDLVELERSLGLRTAAAIPSDRLVPQSVNEGIPVVALSPRSRVARAFTSVAKLFLAGNERKTL